jgi:hypothetical protein
MIKNLDSFLNKKKIGCKYVEFLYKVFFLNIDTHFV